MTDESGGERVEAQSVGSKEWEAAIESIPQIVAASRRLIDLSSRNKEILDQKKWRCKPRNPDQHSSKTEEFGAIDGEAIKGPNGETLQINIWYPDEVSNDPNFLQVYGDSTDGYFSFSYTKDSLMGKTEELEIGFDQDQWDIRVGLAKSENTLSNIGIYFKTTSDGDRLFVEFKDSRFDEQGNINLPKDRAYINTILHFPRTSFWRENVAPQDREEIMRFLEDADRQRKEELDKDPSYKERLEKRIGFVPSDNYAQVQQERINNLPSNLNWFESLNNVNDRIQKTIAAFESSFQT